MEPPDDGIIPSPGVLLPSFQAGGLASLPEYIIRYFLPSVAPLLARYPTLFRRLAPLLTVYWFGRSGLAILTQTLNRFRSLLISTAAVTSRQETLYDYVIEWISKHKTIQAERGVVAIVRGSTQMLLHYSRSQAMDQAGPSLIPGSGVDKNLQMDPAKGVHYFWYKGRPFSCQIGNSVMPRYPGIEYPGADDIQLTCLGRSTQPLEDLLEVIYRLGELEQQNVTVVRRAGGERCRAQWQRAAVKAKRMIDTVILPAKAKTSILADMAEYLNLKTKAEYQARGIPYRRGYLFHGPPGTGKTSLAMALAGHFGLDVYIVSLLDKSISDATLQDAVVELPKTAASCSSKTSMPLVSIGSFSWKTES